MSQVHDINLSDCSMLRKWRLDSPEAFFMFFGKNFKWAEATFLQDPLGFVIRLELDFMGPEILTVTSQSTLDVDEL